MAVGYSLLVREPLPLAQPAGLVPQPSENFLRPMILTCLLLFPVELSCPQ